MSLYLLPVVFVLFVWWFGTGIILYLDGLPRRTYRYSLLAAAGALCGALYALTLTRNDTTVAAAYCAFACAVVVWGFLEMTFLMGYVTGPRSSPCPPEARGLKRARYALETILYHEFALVAAGVLVAMLTAGGSNRTGLATFGILWAMRQSAKLNVFLGVRNLSEEFLPTHLRYLETYFTRKPMNFLFPFAVTAATVLAAMLWRGALDDGAGSFEATSYTFMATLLSLAILEHWFLVLPLPATALWRWGLRSREHAGRACADGRASASQAESTLAAERPADAQAARIAVG